MFDVIKKNETKTTAMTMIMMMMKVEIELWVISLDDDLTEMQSRRQKAKLIIK